MYNAIRYVLLSKQIKAVDQTGVGDESPHWGSVRVAAWWLPSLNTLARQDKSRAIFFFDYECWKLLLLSSEFSRTAVYLSSWYNRTGRETVANTMLRISSDMIFCQAKSWKPELAEQKHSDNMLFVLASKAAD